MTYAETIPSWFLLNLKVSKLRETYYSAYHLSGAQLVSATERFAIRQSINKRKMIQNIYKMERRDPFIFIARMGRHFNCQTMYRRTRPKPSSSVQFGKCNKYEKITLSNLLTVSEYNIR